jgi:hypothetical protein
MFTDQRVRARRMRAIPGKVRARRMRGIPGKIRLPGWPLWWSEGSPRYKKLRYKKLRYKKL